MSGRKKLLKQQVIDQMFAKQISVGEARARWDWIETGVYQPPGRGGGYQDAAMATVDRRLLQAARLIAKGKKRALQAGRLMDLEVTKARKGLAGPCAGYEQYALTLTLRSASGPGRRPSGTW